jgi:GAF domain-containing protein
MDDSSSVDPVPWLGRVRERITPMCDSCVSLTEVDGGGVGLLSSDGVRSVLYATDDVSLALENLQTSLAEGPCLDAAHGRTPVLIGDLRDPREGVRQRWPFFIPEAERLEVRSVFVFPLRIGGIVLGTLELYRREAGRLPAEQVTAALRSADDMGTALIDVGGPEDVARIGALAASVHQAAGMVMVQLDSTVSAAMAQLRARAFAEGLSLVDIAAQVVSGRRRFAKDPEEHA